MIMFNINIDVIKELAIVNNHITYLKQLNQECSLDYIIKKIVKNETKTTDKIIYDKKKKLYITKGILIPFMVMIEDKNIMGIYENITMLFHNNNNVYYKIGDFHNDINNKLIIENWISTANNKNWENTGLNFLKDLHSAMCKRIYNETSHTQLISSCNFNVRNWPIKYVNITYKLKKEIPKIINLSYIYKNKII